MARGDYHVCQESYHECTRRWNNHWYCHRRLSLIFKSWPSQLDCIYSFIQHKHCNFQFCFIFKLICKFIHVQRVKRRDLQRQIRQHPVGRCPSPDQGQRGKITAVNVLKYPSDNDHSQQINDQALPVYKKEAVEAQSADIQQVSGATVTYEGFTQSLQNAITQAKES